ncbi:MAG TPA: hypothetical protein VFP68_17960 [Burkholderiaceae bacterium]|nr:hypothetical protein [Burkholderiaceae bacterium]
MVAEKDYKEARNVAASVAGFDGSEGIRLSDAKKVLDDFGINATVNERPEAWSELPDFAVITVQGKETDNGHAVVFRRKDGEEYIFDGNRDGPIRRSDADYALDPDEGARYLTIHK